MAGDRADWDPEQYAKFATLRARPFWDLAALIDRSEPIERMVDLGCGSGELTAALAAELGVRSALGVDASPAMLDRAAAHADGRVAFEAGDIATWPGEPGAHGVDLIVANASLQWVADHPAVLARWTGGLRAGGQLAVQVPANADHPSHRCSVAVAAREPFVSAFDGAPPPDPVAENVLLPEQYSELLHDLGVADPHVRLQVYPQVMPTSRHVVDWVAGTSLTRFFTRLPEELHQPFVDAFTAELLGEIGHRAPYFYAFKRILIHGRTAPPPNA